MKNKVFSRGLYVEGMKQCRPIGIAFFALAVILGLFDAMNILTKSLPREGDVNVLYTTEMVAVVAVFCCAVAVPLMCLSLFHFLNTRNGSDFYHSVPCSRTAVFFSFSAAILTWAMSALAAIVVMDVLCGVISPAYSSVQIWEFLSLYAQSVVISLQVLAALLLAMSISSTLISQVIVAGLILFLPRGLIDIFKSSVMSAAPVLVDTASDFGWFFDSSNNLTYQLVTGIFVGGYDSSVFSGCLYTLCLAAIIGATALICFTRRRSEIATSTAPNVVVQTAVRTLVALVFCIYPCAAITGRLCGSFYDLSISDLIVWYGLALLTYAVYEIISQRGFRGVGAAWKSMLVGLALLVVLNVALILGPVLCARVVCEVEPQADEVACVTLPRSSKYQNDYASVRASMVELDDAELIELVTQQLSDNITMIKSGVNPEANQNYNGGSQCVVFINLKNGKSVIRNIFFDNSSREEFSRLLSADEDFVSAVVAFPADDEISEVYADSNMSSEQVKEIYDILVDEINSLPAAERISMIDGSIIDNLEASNVAAEAWGVSQDSYILGYIHVSGSYQGESYRATYGITTSLPKTAQAYVDGVNSKKQVNLREVLANADDYVYLDIVVDGANLRDAGGEYVYTETQYFSLYKDIEEYDHFIGGNLEQELLANEGKPVDVTKPFYSVGVNFSNATGEYYAYDNFFVQANQIEPAMLDWVFGSASDYDLSIYMTTDTPSSDTEE